MVELLSWYDEDVLFTFNSDHDLKLNFSQCHKRLYLFNIMLLMPATCFSAYFVKPLQLNLDSGRCVQLECCSDLQFDFDLWSFPTVTKYTFSTICHLWVPLHTLPIMLLTIDYLWMKHYDFGKVDILNCLCERIAKYIWGALGRAGHCIADRILLFLWLINILIHTLYPSLIIV